jgi:hypothetical protein
MEPRGADDLEPAIGAIEIERQAEPMLPAEGQRPRARGPRLRQFAEPALPDDGGLMEALSRERLASVRVGEVARKAAGELDAAEFARREAASATLLDPAITDPELWAMLDRDPLPREARERLLDAACRRILERPRGALGIRMGNVAPPRSGVMVQSTVPGLPADRVLLPGDVVQRVDGAEVNSIEDMANELQSRAPGQEVRLQLVRAERDAAGKPLQGPDGRPVERQVEIRVPLGNAVDLDRADRAGMRAGIQPMPSLVVQRRTLQVAILRRRFAGEDRPWVVPEPVPDAVPPAPTE